MQDEEIEQTLGIPLELAIVLFPGKASLVIDEEEFFSDVHVTDRLVFIQGFCNQLFILCFAIVDLFLELGRYDFEIAIFGAAVLEVSDESDEESFVEDPILLVLLDV